MEKETAIKKISQRFEIPEMEVIELLSEIPRPAVLKTAVPKKAKPKPKAMISLNNPVDTSLIKKYFFLENDYKQLIAKINKVLIEIQRLGDEVGKSCEQSESWHDNFCYEEGGRQQKMWISHLQFLRQIRENVEIIEPKNLPGVISIGSEVEIETNDGKILKKRIGSYIAFATEDLSYESPLAKLLIGKKTGETVTGLINNKLISFKIKSVL